MQEEQVMPEPLKEVSKRMKVVYLGQPACAQASWDELPTYDIGHDMNVEELIKYRWLEYDEDLGF